MLLNRVVCSLDLILRISFLTDAGRAMLISCRICIPPCYFRFTVADWLPVLLDSYDFLCGSGGIVSASYY